MEVSKTKDFIDKYDIKERDILVVQMMANDVSRETIAERTSVNYKALAMRIAKLKDKIGVKGDAALTMLFYKNGLID